MKLNVKEVTVFGVLGCVMFLSKMVMESLPNMHLLAVFTVVFTVVFRQKALYPIYVYVFLLGLIYGFTTWWIPHLYLWTILWGVTMLLPRNMKGKTAIGVYGLVCAAHGFMYGILYAPAQALLFGLDFKGMMAWIIAGLPFDAIHGVSNLILGIALIYPLLRGLQRAKQYILA